MNIRSKSTSPAGDEHYNDDDNIRHVLMKELMMTVVIMVMIIIIITIKVVVIIMIYLVQGSELGQQLGARRIEFISTVVICVVFAVSFAHLEYYYIKDPALQMSNGKVQVIDPNFDRSRETEPIIGNMYQYHLFPMLFIFILISFAALFDDMTFRLFGKSKRKQAFFLGIANLITAITVEDFAWFVNRWLVPLKDYPKGEQLMQFSDWTSMHLGALDIGGTFVIPYWYLIAIAGATMAYYIAFRKHDKV